MSKIINIDFSEDGQALVEYILIISLVTLSSIIMLRVFSNEVITMYFEKILLIITNALSTL